MKFGVFTCAAKLGEGQSRISNACVYKGKNTIYFYTKQAPLK